MYDMQVSVWYVNIYTLMYSKKQIEGYNQGWEV